MLDNIVQGIRYFVQFCLAFNDLIQRLCKKFKLIYLEKFLLFILIFGLIENSFSL